MVDITEHEAEEIDRVNASDRTPVVFVHGLWLLPSSWDRWRAVFEHRPVNTRPPGMLRPRRAGGSTLQDRPF